MSFHLHFYIALLALITPTSVFLMHTTVDRKSDGDEFQSSCKTCGDHYAHCDKWFVFTYTDRCKCDATATYFHGMCRKNLPQDQMDCKLFLENDEYYGLKTRELSHRTTRLGYVKDKWYWDRSVFSKCTIDDESTYWDTQRWTPLFRDGRLISDFRIDNDDDEGVRMYLEFRHHDDRWHMYKGLLIQLSATCYSSKPIPHSGLTKDNWVQSYSNGLYRLKSCLMVKFEGERTYYVDDVGPATLPVQTTVHVTAAIKSTTEPKPTHGPAQSTGVVATSSGKGSVVASTSIPSKPTRSKSSPIDDGHAKKRKSDGGGSNTIYVILLIVMVSLFAMSSFYCYRYRSKYGALTNRNKLTASYGSTESGDILPNYDNTACDVVRKPMYADVKELENWTKMSRQQPQKNVEEERFFPNQINSPLGSTNHNFNINGALLPDMDSDDDTLSCCTYEPYHGGRAYLTHEGVRDEAHLTDDGSVHSTTDGHRTGDGGVLYFVHEDKIR